MAGKPDYTLKVKARDGKYATRVGAAWRTRSGDGINIKLDPGIALVGLDGIDITLWPFEERQQRDGGAKPFGGGGNFNDAADDFGDSMDDVPF